LLIRHYFKQNEDEDAPNQHAFGGEIERPQRELASNVEWRVGDDPVRFRQRAIVQEIIRRFSKALVKDV
jgi:hypothetical protein